MAIDNSPIKFRPSLFQPSIVRGVLDSTSRTQFFSFGDEDERNIGSSSSFRYDPPGVGLRSTQQINVDYSKFENHTFFQSAQVNVNIAFSKIIDQFPFDGKRRELEEFLDNLTGFEKYVYDVFPKNIGYLFFSGSGDISGTFIEVKDFAGAEYPTLSKNNTGDSILDPQNNSISFELQLFVPSETNSNSIILQKLSGSNHGITLFLSNSNSTTTTSLCFNICSGSSIHEISASLTKGEFNHVVATLNKTPGINKAQLYINEELVNESTQSLFIGQIDFRTSPFIIGSGSAFRSDLNVGTNTFTPVTTLSGAMDELRIFHGIRILEHQKGFATKGIFPSDDLKLYFKFNEPTGTLALSTDDSLNRVVLDYSGNSLHSKISENGFKFSLRNTSSLACPMINEKLTLNPILFPMYSETADLNVDLLLSATIYDNINPNLITKLIPPHYFKQGQHEQGFSDEQGDIIDEFTGDSIPGSGKLGSTQILSEFLYVWAKFWDELKIYADSFSSIFNVDYDRDDTTPDQFLTLLARSKGFDLPNIFSSSDIEQFIDSENVGVDIGTTNLSLQQIQNEIWRRILVNLRDIIESKGTINSIKSFIRSVGIDPDSTFRIREFGGYIEGRITDEREKRTEISTMLDMSGSTSFISSSFLSGSRLEKGFPEAIGVFVQKDRYPIHGISNNVSDGLWTSGSFTYEGIYKFPIHRDLNVTQSLLRMYTTGTSTSGSAVVTNLIAISGSDEIRLIYKDINENPLEIHLTGTNIFDGNLWNISFGRFRNDDETDFLRNYPNIVRSYVSGTYFLRAARSEYGEIKHKAIENKLYSDATGTQKVFQNIMTDLNSSGLYLGIGQDTLNITSGSFLNNTTNVTASYARETNFDGLVGHIRFWSKGLLEEEWLEHVKNFKSLGVENPLVNFNFETQESGSFNKLRVDVSTDQPITASNSNGNILLFDFSQNRIHFSGTGFQASTVVINPETFYYSYISPRFDESSTTNKVRARSFIEPGLAKERGVEKAPVYEISPSNISGDDVRFTIDFSIVDALDQDIINIFSTLKVVENAIGSPEMMFSSDYPKLENLRNIYFNRLSDKINLKSFFEFFMWFDSNIGHFIQSLLPNRVKFRGINYVIESHMLERAKLQHHFYEQYLHPNQRKIVYIKELNGGMSRF